MYFDVIGSEPGEYPVTGKNKNPVNKREQQGEYCCREYSRYEPAYTEHGVALQEHRFMSKEAEYTHKTNKQAKREGVPDEQDLEQAACPDTSRGDFSFHAGLVSQVG
jgi:hypothetical protein